MPNTILTPKIIAQEALMVLESQLTMAGLVHRDYSKEFVRVGDTITIRKPAKFVAKNFVGETHGQDITEGSTTVKMDRFRDVTVNVSSKELTLDMWWSSGRCRTLHNAGLSGRRCDQCSCGRNGQRISGNWSKSVI